VTAVRARAPCSSAFRSVLRRLDDLLFGPETPARLLVVQAGFMLVIGFRTVLSPYPKLTPQPDGLFRPVPYLRFLDHMPPVAAIVAFQVVGALAVLAWFWAGLSPRLRSRVRRSAYALAWCCLFVLAGLRASRGKILHIELLLVWASLPFVLAPGDATLADRRPQRRTGWPIRSSIALVSAAYLLTGVWKLRNSGLDWIFSNNMRWALSWAQRDLGLFIAHHAWLAKLSAAGIMLFELGFPIVLVWRRARPAFVIGAWLLHAGTFLTLGLDYWLYACVVTILLVDWPPLLDRLRIAATTLRARSRWKPPSRPDTELGLQPSSQHAASP
jgi:hypothetical protein